MPIITGKDHCASCPMRPLSIFSNLDLDILKTVDFQPTVMTYEAGERIYAEAESGKFAYTLRVGLVKLSKGLRNGRSQIIRLNKQGDIFGLDSFAHVPYNHDATALTDVEVCKLPVETLHDLRRGNKAIDAALLERWIQNLRTSEDMMLELGAKKAPEKLATFLIRWCEGKTDNDWQDLPLSRAEIGEVLGLTLETVSRFLSDWKRRGLITEKNQKVRILDASALQAISCPDS